MERGRTPRVSLHNNVHPRQLGIPFSLAYERRGGGFPIRDVPIPSELQKLSKDDLDLRRISVFVWHPADYYMQQHAEKSELAIVVAENIPEMEKHLVLRKLFKESPDGHILARMITWPIRGQDRKYRKCKSLIALSDKWHFADKRMNPFCRSPMLSRLACVDFWLANREVKNLEPR